MLADGVQRRGREGKGLRGPIQTVSKTTERTPRAASSDAQASPEAPPPMTATVGSAGTGVENTTCSWWKLFLMADRRENPGFPRRTRRGAAPPLPEEAATTLARRAAGSAVAGTTRGGGGITAVRRNARARTVPLSLYGGFFVYDNTNMFTGVGFLFFFG